MTPEKDRELRQRYPLVFAGRLLNDEPIRCNDGWFDLLDKLCATLEQLIAALPDADDRQAHRAVQVKEKFGALRFYTDRVVDKQIADAIAKAERASTTVCDICSKPGELGTHKGVVATRCAEHAKLIARGEQ